MKTFFFLLVLALACPRPTLAQNTQLSFAQAAVVGDVTTVTAGRLGYVQAVADAQGNAYFAGSFVGTVRFGTLSLTSAGGADVFVAKRNAAGTYLWAAQGGGPDEQQGTALAVDGNGDVVVTGYFQSRTASFGGTTLTNASPATASLKKDVFVAKLSGSSQTWLWAVSAGGGTRINGQDVGQTVAVDLFGNVYVAGTFDSSVAFFGPTIQVASTYPDENNVFLAKLTAAGQWVWVKGGDYLGYEVGGLSTDNYSNVYLTGGFTFRRATFGTIVLTAVPAASFVAKIDGTGVWLWAKSLYPKRYTKNARMYAARSDGRDGLYLAGAYAGDTLQVGATTLINTGNIDAFTRIRTLNGYVARLHASTGALQWVLQTGGNGDEDLRAPQLDGAGHVLVGGGFSASSTFGTTALQSSGGSDLVVAQLDTAGRWLWARQAGSATSGNGVALYGLDGQGRGLLFGAFQAPSVQLGTFALLAYPGQTVGQSYTAFTAQLGANGPLAAQGIYPMNDFTVYPNPTREKVTVSGLKPGQAVQVIDVLGRTILKSTMPAQGALQLMLPTQMPTGLYLVRAGAQARRLVVE